jgi:hypothetical protein
MCEIPPGVPNDMHVPHLLHCCIPGSTRFYEDKPYYPRINHCILPLDMKCEGTHNSEISGLVENCISSCNFNLVRTVAQLRLSQDGKGRLSASALQSYGDVETAYWK